MYVVEYKMVTPRVKHVGIPVWFIQEQFENGLFIPKYENSSVVLDDMCTKPCTGPIIRWSTTCMTGLRFYPTSDTEHYQPMRLH